MKNLNLKKIPAILFATITALFSVTTLAEQLASTPQLAAQFYAGLDTPSAERKTFQKQTNAAWQNYEKLLGQPLLTWSSKEVDRKRVEPVFYPFSGPDFLTVDRIFPAASRYVLVAQQKALQPVYPEKMNEKQRAAFEKKLGAAWDKFGILGYFRTEDLDNDQRDKQSYLGVTTILMAFASRLGYEVVEVVPLEFDVTKGEWQTINTDAKWSSVRLSLSKAGRQVTLDYLSMDISDDGLRKQPEQRAWIKQMANQPILLKAASHLLQKPYFDILRSMIVNASPIVVQDETGLNYADLSKIGTVKLYGNFIKPQVLFKSTTQGELAAAYQAEQNKNELPFAFSYLKQSELRSMQIARRSQPDQKSVQKSDLKPLPAQK
jgi:hypothetical protein